VKEADKKLVPLATQDRQISSAWRSNLDSQKTTLGEKYGDNVL